MGAEIGATNSVFAYDQKMAEYLRKTGRDAVADLANKNANHLKGDQEVYANPEHYFDKVIEIDLDKMEPYINGPFSPDKAWKISEFANAVKENGYPEKLDAGLIGSCTNSSYEDLSRSASLVEFAKNNDLEIKSHFYVTPGSELIRHTIERDGLLQTFQNSGARVLANACGPCIGQWDREDSERQMKNSIVTSYNRNFAKRADGNPNTHAFVASPEIVTALSIAGSLSFNPLTDTLTNSKGETVKLNEPKGLELPAKEFEVEKEGLIQPNPENYNIEVRIEKTSDRLEALTPFSEFDKSNYLNCRLLIKVKGKCTTDHISMAGSWLKYRGHLDNISNNLLIGAVNVFNEKTNSVLNPIARSYTEVPKLARAYKAQDLSSVIIGDENYGEGSSREHAAMEPRHLGVKVVISKSFARIHETNLKKQGVLALSFKDKNDYNKIKEDDQFSFSGVDTIQPGSEIGVKLIHADGSIDEFTALHTYSQNQIDWLKAGSAINLIRKNI
jgi:aconitate hydratase